MNGWLLANQHGRRVRKEKGHDKNEVGGGLLFRQLLRMQKGGCRLVGALSTRESEVSARSVHRDSQ